MPTKLTIVVPVYFNEANLPDTIPQLLKLRDQLPGNDLELVFVDDGSKDQSLMMLRDFQKHYPKIIKVVKMTRNFGSMAAIQAGLQYATGDCVSVISADLQDPPELIIDMYRHWQSGVKAVLAVRKDRNEGWLQKLFANSYYWLLRRFAIPNYPAGGFDFVLIDRQVVNDLLKIQEKNTHIMGLIFWLGYPFLSIPYVRKSRQKGRSRWTLSKKIKLLVDSFVSFSYFPIRIMSTIGILYAIASLVYGTYILFNLSEVGSVVRGWLSTMLILTFTAGIQMGMLGILGEYLWRTLDETRKRPFFVVDEVYFDTQVDNENLKGIS